MEGTIPSVNVKVESKIMAEKKKKDRFSQFESPSKPETRKVKPSAPKDDSRGVFERERKKLDEQAKRDRRSLPMSGEDPEKKKKKRPADDKILNINERRQLQDT